MVIHFNMFKIKLDKKNTRKRCDVLDVRDVTVFLCDVIRSMHTCDG